MDRAIPPPRRVVTSMSMTPSCIKTASIPTSAKIVALNDELMNGLEEAAVVEEDTFDPNTHCVMHFYTALNSELRARDSMLLSYHSQSKRRVQTPRKRSKGSKPYISEPSAFKENEKLTITRAIEGLPLAQETEEGTPLPKPRLEEKTVAEWLIRIVDSLHPIAQDLTQSQVPIHAGPLTRAQSKRARAHATIPDRPCWSSDFSTGSMSGTEFKSKPDVVLITPDLFDTLSYSNFSWRNVVSFLALASEDIMSHLHLEITGKAYAVFVAQPGRRFVIALYDIHRAPHLVARVLAALTFGLPEHFSYGPTLRYSSVVSRRDARHLCARPTIRVDKKIFTIICLLFHSEMIRGNSILCFVIEDDEKRRYVVKDSWTRIGGVTTEEHVLKRIKDRNLTYRFPIVEAARTVRIGDADDSKDPRRPGHLFPRNNALAEPETRIHRRLLLTPVGSPLTEFSCIQELLSVLIDIIEIHEILVTVYSILHRDISINNLLMYHFIGDTWPIRKENKELAHLSERERIISERGFRRGLLIDYDYARPIDGTTTGLAQGERTGTLPFMAFSILHAYALQERVTHEPKHDLEAIIYVLTWICVLYRHPTSPQGAPLSAQQTRLNAWTKCKTLQDVRLLASIKHDQLLTRVPMEYFTSYFESLKEPVRLLYGAIARSCMPPADVPLTHDTVKTILLDAFFNLEESAPNMDCVREHLQSSVEHGVKRKMGQDVHTTNQSRRRYK